MFPSRLVSVLGGGAGLQNNYSLAFDGTNDYVALGLIDIDLSENWSISAWINTTNAGIAQYIFTNTKDGSNRLGIRIASDNIVFGTYNGSAYTGKSGSVSASVWNHMVATITNNTLALYINGVAQAGTSTPSLSSTAATRIGVKSDSSTEPFNGNIDEVAIWDTVLSAGDISALYSARGTANLNDDGNSANLQGWWRMGDGKLDSYPLIADQTNATLGSELWDSPASVFTSGTYAWVAYNNNTIANDSNTLKITYVDSANGAYVHFKDTSDLSSDLVVGRTYKFTCDVKVGSGDSVGVALYNGSTTTTIATVTDTSFTEVSHFFVANSVNGCWVRTSGFGSGEDIWFDNLSLKQVNGNPGLMTNMASGDIVEDTP